MAGRRGINVGTQLGQGTIGQVRRESFDNHVAVFEQRFRDCAVGNIHTYDGHSPTLMSRGGLPGTSV